MRWWYLSFVAAALAVSSPGSAAQVVAFPAEGNTGHVVASPTEAQIRYRNQVGNLTEPMLL
jgi:hypothetical protein